jgi:transcriptional regulator with XRE-family HTH domain
MDDRGWLEAGRRVRAEREAMRLSRAAFCRLANLDVGTLRKLEEHGGLARAHPATRAKVEQALGHPLDWLESVALHGAPPAPSAHVLRIADALETAAGELRKLATTCHD